MIHLAMDALEWVYTGLMGLGFVVLLISTIWYLIATFVAHWPLALVSLFLPFVGLILLVKEWKILKYPFLAQTLGFLLCIVPLIMGGEEVETVFKESGFFEDWQGEENEEESEEKFRLFVFVGWEAFDCGYPGEVVSKANPSRGEYVAVISHDKPIAESERDYQVKALQEFGESFFEIKTYGQTKKRMVGGGVVGTTYGFNGRSRLPGQEGKPIAAQITFFPWNGDYLSVVQWRTSAWDQETETSFGDMLHFFGR